MSLYYNREAIITASTSSVALILKVVEVAKKK
jgi:hypothetical protein